MAADRWGATFWQVADCRISRLGHAYKLEAVGGGVCRTAARTRLDRRPHHSDRISLGGGPHGALCGVSRRIRSTQRRCNCRWGAAVPAARQATSVIPIVFAIDPDPLGSGWVASLARPGGTVTGLSNQSADLVGKRVELLREVVPGLRRLAILANANYPAAKREIGYAQDAARRLGLDVTLSEIQRADDIAPAIDAFNGRADALYVVSEALMNTNRVRINTFALAARLPTMHANREYIETGGLISYGANYPDLFRRAGDYVDRILRGAKPGEIPVEQPTKFDLVINLTTARAIGLTMPPTLLARADEVIE
jgi:ABC-type uncharacterized transport system substrate-binding protein